MASPEMYAAVDHSVAAALARARQLMAILDQPHQSDELYARMRAIRHELDTMDDLFPVIGLPVVVVPDLPPLAHPSGEQTGLPLE